MGGVVLESAPAPALWRPDPRLLSWAEDELRRALGRTSLLDARPYEIFGQGSRVNGTAVGDSADIDLVLMLKGPVTGGYGWEQFRDDVLATLAESWSVRMGRRCLNVVEPGSLFGEMVDILVATEFTGADQGVFFRDLEGRPIVNFPRRHRRNGDAKDLRTGGRFKPVVRSAKQAKKRAEAAGLIAAGAAPSYLLECLLHNVPDEVYRTTSHRAAFEWLRHTEPDGLPCQNGINRIFGPGPDQWAPRAAGTIIDVLHEF